MQTCPEHRLVLVSWSSFLVWNHWAMFMNGSWWRHQLEFFSASLAFCAFRAGHTMVTGEFPHKGQWRGTLIFSLICVRINGLVKKHKAADLGHHRAHYDVIVMWIDQLTCMAQAFSRNEVHEWYGRPISNRCEPVTSYGDILLCEHWFR